MSSNKQVILTTEDWSPNSSKFMQPKINDRGGKSISIISTQTNRSLHLSTPLMMTWGISDYVDEKGDADGKFTMTLNFPNTDFATPATTAFLEKLKAFENYIIDEAVKHSESWWGQEMSREIVKFNFFSFLKYSKDKVTKKTDFTRPPSIRAKVPFYENKWAVEIYDTNKNRIFPCEQEHLTPIDFVPKMSNVACILQCGGIWIGGKGWGLTWKLIQCVVKPREIVSVYGKCHIQLSDAERASLESQQIKENENDEEIDEDIPSLPPAATPAPVVVPVAAPLPTPVVEPVSATMVEDSDDEKPAAAVAAPAKKLVKKPAVAAAVAPVEETSPATPVEEAPVKKAAVKKVVKK